MFFKGTLTWPWNNIHIIDEFQDQTKFCLKRFLIESNRLCSTNQNQSLRSSLRKLRQNKSIKICQYDKENGVVALNSEDYYSKLDHIIDGPTKFIKVNTDGKVHPIIAKENSINYYINKYLKSYDNSIASKIVSIGSTPRKLHGTIKVHKQGNPSRPVVSMIDTPEYNLAKFLDQIIKPYIPNQFMLDSTFHLLDKLKEFFPSSNQIMVSFDVVSLFTNVPLEETIDMIVNYIYKENNPSPPSFEKDVFVKLMRIATQELFLYKDTLYKEIDGVTMGCPLGPTLANFFIAHMENQLLYNDPEASPKLYLRYIDDIFAIFDND